MFSVCATEAPTAWASQDTACMGEMPVGPLYEIALPSSHESPGTLFTSRERRKH